MDPKETPKWIPNGAKFTLNHNPNWPPNRFPKRLQMSHPSNPKSISKALSDPFPDPAIHELSGRVSRSQWIPWIANRVAHNHVTGRLVSSLSTDYFFWRRRVVPGQMSLAVRGA